MCMFENKTKNIYCNTTYTNNIGISFKQTLLGNNI